MGLIGHANPELALKRTTGSFYPGKSVPGMEDPDGARVFPLNGHSSTDDAISTTEHCQEVTFQRTEIVTFRGHKALGKLHRS